ncbi:hypothetical protein GCM10009613_61160 [Pseudonocardia kongjuensis]|uniref:K structural protein n=1 Tax=Pseudonocardia kongjuensis TaxID=102227 RepID=A0ABN1YA13_9PSEU
MDLTQKREDFGSDDQSWIASRHGLNNGKAATLDVSLFTKSEHYPEGFFKSGIPLAKITATGKVGPYDGAATDGRGTLYGFLLTTVKAPADPSTDVVGPVLLHGFVKASNLPIEVDAAGQADVAGRLIFT